MKIPFSAGTVPVAGAASRAGEDSRAAAAATEGVARWPAGEWAEAGSGEAVEAGAEVPAGARRRTKTRSGETCRFRQQ